MAAACLAKLMGADRDDPDQYAALMLIADGLQDLNWLRRGMVKVK